jgi:SpoVK/Ycf46/Vps4 family AAA+-type ATPase
MFPNEKIVALIESLKSNEQKKSDKILRELIALSEKRGTHNVSKKLRKAYSIPYKENSGSHMEPSSLSEGTRTTSSDEKLFEIRKPLVGRNSIILSRSNSALLDEIVRSYKDRALLAKHNVPVESRILLHGPPGTGKTLFAYILARELDISIMHVNIDSLISSYLGETGKNISKIFEVAESGGYLVLLDEFDAIAKSRDDSLELGELKRVVTVLLQNLDSLNSDVVIVAATNHEHLLDSAIRRRFAYEINLDYLDTTAREKLLRVYLKGTSSGISFDKLSKLTEGLSGANIKQAVNRSLRKWIFSQKKDSLNDILLEEVFKYLVQLEPFSSKDPRLVSRVVTAVNIMREANEAKYIYSYLEQLTNISDSTLHNLVTKEHSRGN